MRPEWQDRRVMEPRIAGQHRVRRSIVVAGVMLLGMISQRLEAGLPPAVAAPAGTQWVRTFEADFTQPDATLDGWTYMTGDGSQFGLHGWGTGEQQIYTTDPSNINIADGALNIVARVQDNGTTVTSARITTQNLFSQAYGLFQFTARLPAGPDLWPAFWLLPATTPLDNKIANGVYGDWPRSGEIDVMESGLGRSLPPNQQVQGTFHSGADHTQVVSKTDFYNTNIDPSFDTGNLNTYNLLWLPGPDANTPGTLEWYVNGNLYEKQTGGWYNPPGSPSATAPYDQPFYIVMNLAVGGPETWYTGNQMPVDGTYVLQITNVDVFQTPEPSTLLLACSGAVGFGVSRMRRQRLGGHYPNE